MREDSFRFMIDGGGPRGREKEDSVDVGMGNKRDSKNVSKIRQLGEMLIYVRYMKRKWACHRYIKQMFHHGFNKSIIIWKQAKGPLRKDI